MQFYSIFYMFFTTRHAYFRRRKFMAPPFEPMCSFSVNKRTFVLWAYAMAYAVAICDGSWLV